MCAVLPAATVSFTSARPPDSDSTLIPGIPAQVWVPAMRLMVHPDGMAAAWAAGTSNAPAEATATTMTFARTDDGRFISRHLSTGVGASPSHTANHPELVEAGYSGAGWHRVWGDCNG